MKFLRINNVYALILIPVFIANLALDLTSGDYGDADIPDVNTFSIVAYDPETGDLGVAVQSKFLAVGSVVPWAKAGIGAIATQSYANTKYGPDGLDLLKWKKTPTEVIKLLTDGDKNKENRQIGIVNSLGMSASHTGKKCHGYAGHSTGKNFAIQGNLLASKKVIEHMEIGYLKTKDQNDQRYPFPQRLINALKGAQSQGGDRRGRQSAALLIVRKNGGYAGLNDRFIEIRVDDHETPIVELERLLRLHEKFYPKEHSVYSKVK